jgi:hypothetical protein
LLNKLPQVTTRPHVKPKTNLQKQIMYRFNQISVGTSEAAPTIRAKIAHLRLPIGTNIPEKRLPETSPAIAQVEIIVFNPEA